MFEIELEIRKCAVVFCVTMITVKFKSVKKKRLNFIIIISINLTLK